VSRGDALHQLIAVLEQIQRLLPADKVSWDNNLVVRLAIERLWITAGNIAEHCRIERGIAAGVEPWSELVGYRNILAHALPGDVSSDRVFADSTADVGPILEQLRASWA
jgi:uncharacterized protein with HEPN domain